MAHMHKLEAETATTLKEHAQFGSRIIGPMADSLTSLEATITAMRLEKYAPRSEPVREMVRNLKELGDECRVDSNELLGL